MTFPQCVKWLVLEFDPQCGTAQAEDSLQLFIPAYRKMVSAVKLTGVPDTEQVSTDVPLWPVLKKYHGTNNWPSTALILPGMVKGMQYGVFVTITIDSNKIVLLINLYLTISFINSGNEVVFSLETASDYVKDEKACFYGFKCTVVGYEWAPRPEEVQFSC